jgi:1-acyl-sn-glycerol-3-phosphate acyltransferase
VTLYRVARALLVALSRTVFRLRVVHGERIPQSGAYVLAPSHRSYLDTPFVAAVTRRRIRFMGKKELWSKGWSAKLFTALGAFPVERDTPDRAALRQSMDAVQGGEPLVIFPEGTRRTGPTIVELHDGAAYVAARTGVPIVPVGIGGSEDILARGRKMPRFKRVVVVVGEPIEPPSRGAAVKRSEVADLTARLEKALQLVFDEAEELAADSGR